MTIEDFQAAYAKLIEAGGLLHYQALLRSLEPVWNEVCDLDVSWFDGLISRMVKEKKTWVDFRRLAKNRRMYLANVEYRKLSAEAKASRLYNTKQTALEAVLKATGADSLWESVQHTRRRADDTPASVGLCLRPKPKVSSAAPRPVETRIAN